MDLTNREILLRNGINLDQEIVSKILPAMDEYAAQEAKAYANWLSNQVIAGRTAFKLWNDYQAELTNDQK